MRGKKGIAVADFLVEQLNNIGTSIAAVAALGTAAYGLVDVTKAFAGGISNAGFSDVKKALAPFDAALSSLGNAPYQTLRANWLNGVAKADQKAAAKALIRLGLTAANAPALAKAVGIDAAALKAAATKADKGTALSADDINILGRFDALVSAILDAGYERGDQKYRTAAKCLACIVAICLSVAAGAMFYHAQMTAANSGVSVSGYLNSKDFVISLIVGAIATPLAPIAKDISTSLAAAVNALGSVRR